MALLLWPKTVTRLRETAHEGSRDPHYRLAIAARRTRFSKLGNVMAFIQLDSSRSLRTGIHIEPTLNLVISGPALATSLNEAQNCRALGADGGLRLKGSLTGLGTMFDCWKLGHLEHSLSFHQLQDHIDRLAPRRKETQQKRIS
jgi:hypothetical protein